MAFFMKRFFKLLKNAPEFQDSMHSIELLPIFDNDITYDELVNTITVQDGSFLPLIIIHPALEKKAAQYVLDKLYEISSPDEGLGLQPRFSKKISNFLYYSQGDPEDRLVSQVQDCFEKPDKALYKKTSKRFL